MSSRSFALSITTFPCHPPRFTVSHDARQGKALESDGNMARCKIVIFYMHPSRYWNSTQNSGILLLWSRKMHDHFVMGHYHLHSTHRLLYSQANDDIFIARTTRGCSYCMLEYSSNIFRMYTIRSFSFPIL